MAQPDVRPASIVEPQAPVGSSHVAAIVVMDDTVAGAVCSMRGAASRRRAVTVLHGLVMLTTVGVQVPPPLNVELTSVMREAATGTLADVAASLRSA